MTLLALTQAASAGDRWISFRSANFTLYTTCDETAGRDALVFFEEIRRAFTEILGVKLPQEKPVTVIAFRDPKTFAQYRPQGDVVAYTLSQSRRDYIVMQDLAPEHYSRALHEYTHVVIEQAGMKVPLWLNEGFAEFYATLKPEGRKIVVGRIIPERLQLAQSGLIDLRGNSQRRSPVRLFILKTNRSGIFYAESWALVHMLKFSDSYSSGFERLLDAIGRGEPGSQALQEVYGKTTGEVQNDLQAYVHRDRFKQGVIHAKLEKSGPEPKLAEVDPLEIAVLLTWLEFSGPHHQEGLQHLEELAKAYPEKLAPLNALAWVRLGGPDRPAAITAFRRAFEAGTRDANLCFQFAMKMRTWIPDADFVAALRRAAEIDPAFSAAQEQLAAYAFDSHDYAEAVTRLHLVKKVDHAGAFVYYRALAIAAFQIGEVGEAKVAAARAQQYAVAQEDKQKAQELLNYVNGAGPTHP